MESIQIPVVLLVLPMIAALVGATMYLAYRLGVLISMSIVQMVIGTFMLGMSALIFASKVFGLVDLCEDIGSWLAAGTLFGTMQMVSACIACILIQKALAMRNPPTPTSTQQPAYQPSETKVDATPPTTPVI